MADDNISPDDALEETKDPDYDTDVGYKNILPEDNDRPFQPAENPRADNIPKDHPITDSNVDLTDLYQDGQAEASGASTQHEETGDEQG
jgi:hypothetical protein